jgi:hypothetical protein
VLLDARAERKVRPLVVDEGGKQAVVAAVGVERRGKAVDHCRVEHIGLRARHAQAQERSLA